MLVLRIMIVAEFPFVIINYRILNYIDSQSIQE